MSDKGATILVVDDNESSRYVKTRVLRQAGYGVIEAGDGAEAVAQIKRINPAIVLLDVRLPDVNGIDLCKQIKANDPNVVVLQTSAAMTHADVRAAALVGGADSYLVEPLEPEELIATVGAMLRLRRAESELRRQNEVLEQKVAERTKELAAESLHRGQAEEALRHIQKLDALGQVTGGIAHDFNNLLTVVSGNLQMLERGMREWNPAKQDRMLRFARLALDASRDCSRLTHQLLAFARRDEVRPVAVDVNAAIRRFEALVRRAAGERIELRFALANDVWASQIDVGQFEAALLNLVINARDASPDGGAVQIETANVVVEAGLPGASGVPAELSTGEYVRVTVVDHGVGMPPDIAARAVEPFFTTKDVGKGSGLGLSQVYGFAKRAGGAIAIESTLGAGTRIRLYLARTREAPAETSAEARLNEPPHGSGTILVVEDNDMVRDFVVQTMGDLGYSVLQAPNGHRAMEIVQGSDPIELLFTDVVMPERMNGIELARHAREQRPGLKVLLTSGFMGTAHEGAPSPTEFPFIAKPYTVVELAQSLRRVIGAP